VLRRVFGSKRDEVTGEWRKLHNEELPMKMEPIVISETSAIRTQTPGNYPKRNKLHLEHGESLKTSLGIFTPYPILCGW